jgi:hypothetical protein
MEFVYFMHDARIKTISLFQTLVVAQVVSRRPLAADARIRDRLNPCGICSG